MLGISICLTFQKLQISDVIIEDFHATVKQVNIAGKHGESARRTGNTEPFLSKHREIPRDFSNRGWLAAKRHTSYLTCSSDRFIPPLRNALEVIRRLEGILGVGVKFRWSASEDLESHLARNPRFQLLSGPEISICLHFLAL